MCDQVYVTCSCCDSFLLGLIFLKTVSIYFYFALSLVIVMIWAKEMKLKLNWFANYFEPWKKNPLHTNFNIVFLADPFFHESFTVIFV